MCIDFTLGGAWRCLDLDLDTRGMRMVQVVAQQGWLTGQVASLLLWSLMLPTMMFEFSGMPGGLEVGKLNGLEVGKLGTDWRLVIWATWRLIIDDLERRACCFASNNPEVRDVNSQGCRGSVARWSAGRLRG